MAQNYSNLENPYNAELIRDTDKLSFLIGGQNVAQTTTQNTDEPAQAGGNTAASSSASAGSVQQASVASPGAMADIIITNSIQSINWKPKSTGFYIDGQSGYAEFTNVFVSGTISALAGNIGGFEIGSDYIRDAANSFGLASTVTGGDDVRFWAGGPFESRTTAPFRVTEAGVMTATSGVIGGFTITTNKLYGGIIQTSVSVGVGASGVIMDSAGLRGYDSVLGLTFNLPTNGSAPTFSSGVINSSIFEINTNAILRTSSTVGDGTANSAGILINDTGLYGCEANQALADANIKVLVDGTAVFNASIRGGQTDYNTGTGYFLGLSNAAYKFSIGTPAGNYMTWDGSYLRIKGSFDVGSAGVFNNSVYTVATLPQGPSSTAFLMPSAYE